MFAYVLQNNSKMKVMDSILLRSPNGQFADMAAAREPRNGIPARAFMLALRKPDQLEGVCDSDGSSSVRSSEPLP
jgi:hypothetical protein